MTQAPVLAPELIKQSIALARALSAAARNWSLYPPEHPTVAAAVRRLAEVVRASTAGAAFAFGITPQTLLVAGLPLPDDQAVAEAARLLHDRDLLQLSFLGDVPMDALHQLLKLLAIPSEDLRRAGGPAEIWKTDGHASIALEQIDYEKLLEDREVERPAERRDNVWQSLVNTILQGGREFDAAQQARLLEISQSAYDIGELASDVMEPKRNLDGSPLITTQAATVLAVFRHLAGIVTVMEPDRLPEVLRNVASATAAMDPAVVLQMMQMDEGVQETPMVAKITSAFDDSKVAQLLASAIARDGMATARLARVFDTIAPDEDRKRRVLSMARTMLGEQDFGKTGQFRAVWASMETLLLSYDETPYVSAAYQASLEGAVERGEMLAARDLPSELPEWVQTLEQDNVRSLSVLLIADLLRIEENPERASELTRDMVALVDDLFLAGDFNNALLVLQELQRAGKAGIAVPAARAALTSVADSTALRDASSLLGDLDESGMKTFMACCEAIGAGAVKALYPAVQVETDTPAAQRARQVIGKFGAAAASHLAALADDSRWFVQRNAAILLGGTRSADAVPPLQALLRKNDPRVLKHAVAALAGIDDPSAARAVQTSLRAATGENRAAVIEALVAERDPRVVPMLTRILTEIDPFGPDHQVLLDTLDAVKRLADERAIPPVKTVMYKKKFFGGKKAKAFKEASVQALIAIGTPKATAALHEASSKGDRALRRAVSDLKR